MASDNNEKIREIFAAARELTAGQRDRYLDSACKNDDALRREIQSLLANDNTDTPPTVKPDPIASARISGQTTLKTIGPYHLLEMIGSGGMGVVYKAEQRSPIRRTVAVKIIKLGFDSHEVIARFDSERQALARMDHPNIAKVLDAGTDDRGSPYFVMEYVPGHPITKYADENRLSIKQRLELMLQVCEAIGHAHAKSIIHRDIKAGNVLAHTTPDGPRIKVIDFGVAKALTSDRLTDLTFNTASGQAIGTYESMSPEQADGSPDIDTRTDVYSLGVLLYELLSGSKPFDAAHLRKAADDELRRIIREDEPPRPSTRISSTDQASAKIAAARKTEPTGLARQLKSELEWIPMMAMRKERARRYQTPQQLADDLKNYLNDAPLLAGPESRIYRLRKTASHYRGVVAAVASILVTLMLGLATTFLMAHKANVATKRAEQNEASAKQATTQALFAEAVVTDQRNQLAREKASLLRQNYHVGIQAAQQEITAGEFDVANRILEDCPPNLRGWEWNYLSTETSPALGELQFPPNMRLVTHDRSGAYAMLVDRGDTPTQIYLISAVDGITINTISLPEQTRSVSLHLSSNAEKILITGVKAIGADRGKPFAEVWDRSRNIVIFAKDLGELRLDDLNSYPSGDISFDGNKIVICGKLDGLIYDLKSNTDPVHYRGLVSPFLSDDGQFLFESGAVAWDGGESNSTGHGTTVRNHNRFADTGTGKTYVASQDWGPTHKQSTPGLIEIDGARRGDACNLFSLKERKFISEIKDYDRRNPFKIDDPRRATIEKGILTFWIGEGGADAASPLCRVKAGYPEDDGLCWDDATHSLFVYYRDSVARFPLPTLIQLRQYSEALTDRPYYVASDPSMALQITHDQYFTCLRDTASFRLISYFSSGDYHQAAGAFSKDGRRIAIMVADSFLPAYTTDKFHVNIYETTGGLIGSSSSFRGTNPNVFLSDEGTQTAIFPIFDSQKLLCLIQDISNKRPPLLVRFDGPWYQIQALGFGAGAFWFVNRGTLHSVNPNTGEVLNFSTADGITSAAISTDRSEIALLRGDQLETLKLPAVLHLNAWRIFQANSVVVYWGDRDRRLFAVNSASTSVSDPQAGEVILNIPEEPSFRCRSYGRQLLTLRLKDFWPAFVNAQAAENDESLHAAASAHISHLLDSDMDPGEIRKMIGHYSDQDVNLRFALENELIKLEWPAWEAENNLAWQIVRSPAHLHAEYKLASIVALRAARLDPASCINTFGVAQYRAGHYQNAIDNLRVSDTVSRQLHGGPIVEDWAFLAMANYRLGKLTEANEALQKAIAIDAKSPFTQEAIHLIHPLTTSPATQPATQP